MKKKEAGQVYLMIGISVFLILIFMSYIGISSGYENGPSYIKNPDKKVQLELFTRSISSSGMQALEQISNAMSGFNEDSVQLEMYFIGKVMDSASYGLLDPEEKRECELQEDKNYYCSANGAREVVGDIIQLCAMEYHPDRFLDLILCQNKNQSHIPKNWKSCAVELNLDVMAIEECAEGQKGRELFKKSASAANSRSVSADPAIFINKKRFLCQVSKKEINRHICSLMDKNLPAPCLKIPDIQKHDLLVITHSGCEPCEAYIEEHIARLRCTLPRLNITIQDYEKSDAQSLYDELELEGLPAFILDLSVDKDLRKEKIEEISIKKKGKYLLDSDVLFRPGKEICDNGLDDNSNGKMDCNDSYCEFSPHCRKEKLNRLDLFVRSHQNQSIMALDSMKSVLSSFNNKIDFNIYYIAESPEEESFLEFSEKEKNRCIIRENKTYFCSAGKNQEIVENIRQLCAKRYAPADYEFMHYIWCRNRNILNMTDWKSCTEDLNTERIERCHVSLEGAQLLKENIQESEPFTIEEAPMIMINNVYMFSLDEGTPKEIKDLFCRYNNKEEC